MGVPNRQSEAVEVLRRWRNGLTNDTEARGVARFIVSHPASYSANVLRAGQLACRLFSIIASKKTHGNSDQLLDELDQLLEPPTRRPETVAERLVF